MRVYIPACTFVVLLQCPLFGQGFILPPVASGPTRTVVGHVVCTDTGTMCWPPSADSVEGDARTSRKNRTTEQIIESGAIVLRYMTRYGQRLHADGLCEFRRSV
jgi:hypothetical protein